MEKNWRQRYGNRWFMCVDDGEASFSNRPVAWVCNFVVRQKHPRGTHWTTWTSGQPCRLSLGEKWPYRQRRTTSLQHLSTVIAYVKYTSGALRIGDWIK